MIETIFWFVFALNIKAAILLGLGCIVSLCLVRFQSELRYSMWKQIFALLAVLPVLIIVIPSITVSLAPNTKPSISESTPFVEQHQLTSPLTVESQRQLLVSNAIDQSEPVSIDERFVAKTSIPWPLLLIGFYLLISLLLLARLIFQYYRCQQRINRFKHCSDLAVISAVEKCRVELGINRRITIRSNNKIETPFVWGLIRSTLVLPETFSQWPTAIQQNTLLHELLHIHKRDTVWGILVKICVCLYWPNPLIWKLSKTFNLEAEKACDEGVLRKIADQESYADQLIKIARYIQPMSKPLATLASPMSGPSTLRQRINNILTNRKNLTMKSFNRYLTAIAVLSISLLVVAIEAQSQQDSNKVFSEPAQRPSYAALLRVEPSYPKQAIADKTEGYVVVEFDISPAGRVANPTVVDSQPLGLFDQSAVDAVNQWLYLPVYENGKAIETNDVRTKLTFRFGAKTKIETDSFDIASLENAGPKSIQQANQLMRYYVSANQPAVAIKLLTSYLPSYSTDNASNNFQNALVLLDDISFHRFANEKKLKAEILKELAVLGVKAELSNSGDVYAAMAKVYQQLQSWPAAQLALAKAFEKGQLTEPAATKLTLAVVLYNTNRYDAALKVVDSVIATYGETDQRLTWREVIDSERYRQNLIADHLVSSAVR